MHPWFIACERKPFATIDNTAPLASERRWRCAGIGSSNFSRADAAFWSSLRFGRRRAADPLHRSWAERPVVGLGSIRKHRAWREAIPIVSWSWHTRLAFHVGDKSW